MLIGRFLNHLYFQRDWILNEVTQGFVQLKLKKLEKNLVVQKITARFPQKYGEDF